jgi:hypothetical protein
MASPPRSTRWNSSTAWSSTSCPRASTRSVTRGSMARFAPAGSWSGPGPSSGSARSQGRNPPTSNGWSRHPGPVRCAAVRFAGRPCRPPSAHRLGTNYADRPHNAQTVRTLPAYPWWVDRGLSPPEQSASGPASRAGISGHHPHQRSNPVPSRQSSGFEKPIARSRRPPAASGLSKTVNRAAREGAAPCRRACPATSIY